MFTFFRKNLPLLLLSGWVASFVVSCKQIESLPAEPANKITAYKIETAEGTLFGAIDNVSNTIRVYLPFYFDFSIIDPVIEISEGAVISGTDTPIEITSANHTYTVTGPDQTVRQYKLIIEIQVTKPLWVKKTPGTTYLGNGIAVIGNFNTKDPREPQLFVVDEAGNEYPFAEEEGSPFSITAQGNNSYSISGYFMPKYLSLEKLYKVRAKYRGLSADGAEWFQPVQFQPQFRNVSPHVQVKRGDTLTRYVAASTLVQPKRVFTTIDGKETELKVVSWDYEKISVVVPLNAPLGISYSTFIEFEGYRNAQIVYEVIE